ncbi:MAG: helix-turn-helix domain-containing protein [Candidatus Omnitrophica bacterium]|nr:helix-turn-helix domain-containing protein [Candidatus Omnitrophota bacterium]
MQNLLTPKQLSDLLQIKLPTVYKWAHYGYVPFVKIGKLLRFKESKVEEWLKKRERRGRSSCKIHVNI